MLADRFMFILADAAVKAALLLTLAAVIVLCSRRASASFRHLVWALGLGGALFLPLLSCNLPHWRVFVATSPVPAHSAAEHATPVIQAAPKMAAAPEKAPAGQAASASEAAPGASAPLLPAAPPLPAPAAEPSRAVPEIPWPVLVFLIWLVGALVALAQLARGLAALQEVSRKSVLVTAGPLAEAARAAAFSLQATQTMQVRQARLGSQVTVPLTYGIRRPVVVLPAEADQWPTPRLSAALLHEMAHVKRRDWALQLLGQIAGALYWFHPLVWVARTQMRTESEATCDDLVLAAGVPAPEYARHLLDVALSVRDLRRLRSSAVAMAQGPKVESRLRAVLAQGLSRHPLTGRRVIGGCVVALLLSLPLAAVRLTSSAQAGETSKGSPTRSISTAGGSDHAILPNGYKISLAAVTQATQSGDEWNMFGGSWWSPDGTPIAPQNGWRDGRQHWSVIASHRLAPYTFKIVVSPPVGADGRVQSSSRYDYHFYAQLVGASGPARYVLNRSNGAGGTAGPLVDQPMPQSFPGAVTGCFLPGFYPAGTQSCVIRCGVASGPWQTVARVPFAPPAASGTANLTQSSGSRTGVSLNLSDLPSVTYSDAQGQAHTLSFLDASSRLPDDIDRQIIAVDTAGRVKDANSDADLSRVREFRLQTRPYQTAEFDSVQLQPRLPAEDRPKVAASLLADASAHRIAEAEQLRTHLQGWAQANKALLQQMAAAGPDDLAAAIRVHDSLVRLPVPLWSGDPRLYRGGDEPALQNEMAGQLTLTHLQRSHDAAETQTRFDFARHRDFVSAEAFLNGHISLVFWASGRITVYVPGADGGRVAREVVPPFLADGASNLPANAARATWLGPPPTVAPMLKPAVGFRRYTSQPLPDGSRYTFLYPSYFAHVQPGWLDSQNQFGTVRIDCIGTQPVPWIAHVGQQPISYYQHNSSGVSWLSPHEEFCSVVVGRAGDVAFPPGKRFLRRDSRWIGQNGSHHDFSITDARSHYAFELIHEDRYTPALFKQTDPVIDSSFRIVPPPHRHSR